MKKLFFLLMLVVLLTASANALPITVGQEIKIQQGIGNANSGGSFYVFDVATNALLFETYCLERNETFNYGISYRVSSISLAAYKGGYAGGNPDPLAQTTAYLYAQWASDPLLHTYAYNNALQLAIWKLEEELVPVPSTSGVDLTSKYNSNLLAQQLVAEAVGGSYYGVHVVNFETLSGAPVQSMLVVPEPTSLLLVGLGLVGVAGFGIRLRK